jgi:mycothiol synthase
MTAEHPDVRVVPVSGVTAVEAAAFLDALERRTGVAPVDEDERRRLAGARPIRDRDWHWGAHLARSGGVPVAYAGTRVAPADRPTAASTCVARSDLALDRAHPDVAAALRAVLEDVRAHAGRSARADAPDEPGEVQAWLRGATAEDLATAAALGFQLLRRLHVLGRALAEGSERPVAVPAGFRLRSFRPDHDDAAVAALLTAVYPHGSGDWDVAGVAARRATDWFRPEDLILLEADGTGAVDGTDVPSGLVGVHWTRRRGDGVGEVHNLAIDPSVQGRGLGGVLLDAGLAHLADVGCHEVLLWVDAANTRAVELYTARGFVMRWDDVALRG